MATLLLDNRQSDNGVPPQVASLAVNNEAAGDVNSPRHSTPQACATCDFTSALQYVLAKNSELYRRLS